MAAPRPLCITEKWIREHLNLQATCLDDVRSLALPGTYHEKITHLGRSLTSFSSLKHLDLSRNALESLEGLEHMKSLETLNLYYNNIPSLKELFRLRHNLSLRELDLRLNPVTKNEPDYRLFVVHMLVNLRKLDDRGVRDSERKAALMHFDTDQAHAFEERAGREAVSSAHRHHRPNQPLNAVPKHIQSRAKLVHSLSRPQALGDDTDELLDLIARDQRVLSSAPPPPPPMREPQAPPTGHSGHFRGHWHTPEESPETTIMMRGGGGEGGGRGGGEGGGREGGDPNLQFTDELHAYTHQRPRSHFTPATPTTTTNHTHHNSHHPHPHPHPPQMTTNPTLGRGTGDHVTNQASWTPPPSPTSPSPSPPPLPPPHLLPPLEVSAVDQLVEMLGNHVVKGSIRTDSTLKSKLQNWFKLTQATEPFSRTGGSAASASSATADEKARARGGALLQEQQLATAAAKGRELEGLVRKQNGELAGLRARLEQRDREAAILGRQLQEQREEVAELRKLRREKKAAENRNESSNEEALQQARGEVSALKQALDGLQKENKSLHEALGQSHAAADQHSALKQEISRLQQLNESLASEQKSAEERHRAEMSSAWQLQELAAMLHESHRALVSTNDHLLQELEETRERHVQEVMQMSANYEHIRKSVDLMQQL